MNKNSNFEVKRIERTKAGFARGSMILAALALLAAAAPTALASEDAPRRPFAEWAEVPAEGQLVFGTLYEQSEAYYIWAGSQRHNITVHASNGESYGIDIRQGYFTLDYGLTERWAADLDFGGTTVGWRSFDPGAGVQQTTGISDTTLGSATRFSTRGRRTRTGCPNGSRHWPFAPPGSCRAATTAT